MTKKIKLVSLSFPLQCLFLGKYHLDHLHKLLGHLREPLQNSSPQTSICWKFFLVWPAQEVLDILWFGPLAEQAHQLSSVFFSERALKNGVLRAIRFGGAVYTRRCLGPVFAP